MNYPNPLNLMGVIFTLNALWLIFFLYIPFIGQCLMMPCQWLEPGAVWVSCETLWVRNMTTSSPTPGSPPLLLYPGRPVSLGIGFVQNFFYWCICSQTKMWTGCVNDHSYCTAVDISPWADGATNSFHHSLSYFSLFLITVLFYVFCLKVKLW